MGETWNSANKAYGNKDWDQAQKLYTKIAEVFPDDSEALFRLGVSAYRQGNNKLAEESFEKVVKLQPNNTKAAYNLGMMRLQSAYQMFVVCSKSTSTKGNREKHKCNKISKQISEIN